MKRILTVLAAATAAFCAFVLPFGLAPAAADTGEISANNEAILSGEDFDGIATSQPERNDGAEDSLQSDSEEDEGGGMIPETAASEWFKEKVVPYILEYGAAALGVLSGLLFVLGKLKKSIANLVGAYQALKKSNTDNETTRTEVETLKTDVGAWTAKQEAKLEEYFAKQEELMEKRFDEIALKVTDKLDDIDETAHKILDVEEIAYEDNPVLVSKGTSKKISEVIHNGEKKNASDV